MGHIQRRSDRPGWRARYIAPDGKERSKTFRRKVDAERFLATVEVDKLRGAWVDPRQGRIRLGEFWQRLEPVLARRVRPTTLDLYQRLWILHIESELGLRSLASLTRFDIEEFVARLSSEGMGAATVGATFRLVHRILEAAVETQLIVLNVARGVKLPALPHTEMRFLSPTEVERLVEATPERWRAFVLLAAWCGLRFGEIAALKLSRVDFEGHRIRVEEALGEVNGKVQVGPTKTKAKRSVALPAFVGEALAVHIRRWPPRSDGLIFWSPEGGPVRRSNFRKRVWLPVIQAAALEPLRFHDLRHTAVALAVAAGGHAKAIQARLGHSSVSMTLDRYGHLLEGLDADLAGELEHLHATARRRPKDPETES